MGNPIKTNRFQVKEKGIPLESLKDMTIGEIRKLDKNYKRLIKGRTN